MFQDVTTIRPGQDFVRTIDRALDDCDAMLAVIGPGWLTASGRLLNTEDFVHMELSRALEREVPVIPVLVGNADLPKATDLPAGLRELSRRQAVELHDQTWHQDVEGLVRSLRGEAPAPIGRRRRWLTGLSVAIVVAAIAGVVWWRTTVTTGNSGSGRAVIGGFFPAQSDKPACPVPSGDAWRSIQLQEHPTGEVQVADGSLTFTVKAASWRQLEPGSWQVILDTAMENGTTKDLRQTTGNYPYLVVADRTFDDRTCIGVKDVTYTKPNRLADGRVGFQVSCMPAGDIILGVDGDTSISGPHEVHLTAATEPSDC